ncbi:MAG: M15 family metallopeptidase [Proteobacteria bacterium]|nr:M15 family metallopeptidase [Pseudomonadota bacterium]
MPASTKVLKVEFRGPADELLADCEAANKPMVAFFTIRHPRRQAELWRQSRSRLEVEQGIAWLRGAGAEWCAGMIERVGPQFGRWATNAAPGNSWHQWALALDSYALVDGRISWDTVPGQVGGPGDAFYRFYAERAEALGLTPMGPAIGDWVHVQGRPESAPSRVMSWPEIDAEMRRRFGS